MAGDTDIGQVLEHALNVTMTKQRHARCVTFYLTYRNRTHTDHGSGVILYSLRY